MTLRFRRLERRKSKFRFRIPFDHVGDKAVTQVALTVEVDHWMLARRVHVIYNTSLSIQV